MKKAILLVSYGAGNPLAHSELRSFELRCREAFPDRTVRWAFTSQLLRSRLISQKKKSDSVLKALLRLEYEHFENVAIQPLQIIPGREFSEVRNAALAATAQTGKKYALGLPLLANADAAPEVATALLQHLPPERTPDEDVIYMGHGARHEAGHLYAQLATELAARDKAAHLGIMSGKPDLSQVLTRLSSGRVWLVPLLSIVGQHALRDMAGNEKTSWKSRIEDTGAICCPVLKGIIQAETVAGIWLKRLGAVIGKS